MLLVVALPTPSEAAAKQSAPSSMEQDLGAMQDFNKLHDDVSGLLKVKKKKQHKILFFMGIGLLVGLLLTAGFGLAMVLGGKQVFLWHMLFAGVTITLAIAHAVTSMIWFYPF
ncbi:MAG TPA: hypothetical protein VJ961_04460 [Mariprofundaceae bacterium]|nr:hypothetical protein [Mariprofundaceae bacterium]